VTILTVPTLTYLLHQSPHAATTGELGTAVDRWGEEFDASFAALAVESVDVGHANVQKIDMVPGSVGGPEFPNVPPAAARPRAAIQAFQNVMSG
jgi:hypothetical protein